MYYKVHTPRGRPVGFPSLDETCQHRSTLFQNGLFVQKYYTLNSQTRPDRPLLRKKEKNVVRDNAGSPQQDTKGTLVANGAMVLLLLVPSSFDVCIEEVDD